MNQAFLDYYRCPESFANFRLTLEPQREARPGYFEFGPGNTCFGISGGLTSDEPGEGLYDVAHRVRFDGSTCILPFNPTDIARNLRYERYVNRRRSSSWKGMIRKLYYALRPLLPVSVRRHLQKAWLKGWDKNPFPRWPVDRSVDQMFEMLMRLTLKASGYERVPFIWYWPHGKSSCATMTHDVETEAGLRFSSELMDINDSFQIKSSFQLIPDARYIVGEADLSSIKLRGFEVNVHDLKHDGHLFDDFDKFHESAARINQFGLHFGSKGFRSAILYRNQEWYGALDFSYDMSVPNVGHLDPQRGGCCTVMPYFIGNLLEIPVTATQDYTLFNVLGTYSLDLWRQQISQIMQQHGLISFIIHPDYLDTPDARNAYVALLGHLSELRDEAGVWIALPGEIDTWWRQRSRMRLVSEESGWRIEGPGAERAGIAYATLRNDKLTYEFA
jgi:hypothetical protein